MATPGLGRELLALRFGLLAAVALTPLPFGSVRPWALLVLELWAAALGGLALWAVSRHPGSLAPPARRMLFPAAALLLVGGLQLVPLPAAWIGRLAPQTALARQATGAALGDPAASVARESLAPTDTLDALLRLTAYVGLGLAAAVALRAPGQRLAAVILVAACGALQALYGSAEYVSGHQHILGWAKKYYTDSASGTFINRNHFAAYLALCLPFALELLLRPAEVAQRAPGTGTGWRMRVLRLHEPAGALRLFGGLAVAAIWAGIFFSFSRGGLVASLIGAALVPVFLGSDRSRRRNLWKVAAWSLVVPLALLLLWQDVRAPGERFLASSEEIESLNSRLPVWQASLGLVADYPLLGSGYGTFEAVFANRQPAGVSARWEHAHNDWLQTLVEGGLAATLALLWLTYLCFARGTRRAPGNGPRQVVGSAAGRAALAAIAVHCLVDFPVRVPAIALLVALVIGLVAAGKETAAPAWRNGDSRLMGTGR